MNKVILKGRITKDIEVRYTQTTNVAVTSFSVAVDRPTKQGEEKKTDFINCVAYSKTAEFVSKYFQKGQEILLTGRIQIRNYDDKDGKKVYVTEIIAENVEFCGSKKDIKEENNTGNDNFEFENAVNFVTNEDDDLPF